MSEHRAVYYSTVSPSRTEQSLIKSPAIKNSFICVYIPPLTHSRSLNNTSHLSDRSVTVHDTHLTAYKHIVLSVVCASHHALAGFSRRMLKAKRKARARIATHTSKLAIQRLPQSQACAGTSQTERFVL